MVKAMKRYGLLCGPLAALTLWTGIAGLAQFVPGYNSVRQTVSEIGEMDSPMRVPFAVLLFVVATLMLLFAWALHRTAKEARRSTLSAYLAGFVAIPLVGIGICAFPHPLHNVFGLSELIAYFAPTVLAFTWRRASGAESAVAFSWIMSALVWLVILANMTPMFRPEPLWHEMKPFYGIVQRALFVSWFGWIAGIGLMLFGQTSPKTP
jgi:hypothetical membrane protein